MTRILAALVLAGTMVGSAGAEERITWTKANTCRPDVEDCSAFRAPTADLDRAVEICNNHRDPNPIVGDPDGRVLEPWKDEWKICNRVIQKIDEQFRAKVAEEKKQRITRDAADLAFVKRVAAAP